jgi:hypothetical protein
VTPDLISAVADAIVPGDALDPPLPSGSAARVASRLQADRHRTVLAAIAEAAGGEAAFIRADAAARENVLHEVELRMRDAFAALVLAILRDYYEDDAVLRAMGWRAEPPQPSGHTLDPFDETLLKPVKDRGRLWRD